MKLGELPSGVVRMVAPIAEIRPGPPELDIVFVRFTCRHCDWTTGFKTTVAGATQISPEHYCPERERQVRESEMGPTRQNPLIDYLHGEAQKIEFGFTGFKFPHSEVM